MRLTLLSWIVLLCLVTGVPAQDAPTKVRSISLDEAIRLALEQNLKIQIGQATPQVTRLNLDASYGYYDPVFSSRVGQDYVESAGRLDPNVGLILGNKSWTENFRM